MQTIINISTLSSTRSEHTHNQFVPFSTNSNENISATILTPQEYNTTMVDVMLFSVGKFMNLHRVLCILNCCVFKAPVKARQSYFGSIVFYYIGPNFFVFLMQGNNL